MTAAPTEALVAHLEAHARSYYPDLGGAAPRVELLRTRTRTNAWLHSFRLIGGERSHEVVAKVRRPRRRPLSEADTPLTPIVADDRKLECEYNALAWIQRHLEPANDPRFGCVRVLELVPQLGAFVMESVPGTNLGGALDPILRGRVPELAPSLRQAVRNSGAWLAAYHRLPALPQTRSEPETSEAFAASLAELVEGVALDRWSGIDPLALERRLVDRARKALPAELPLGLGHGDYRPGNLLAGPSGRVFGIDTFATWRGPVFSDLGHYLFSLKSARRQIYAPAGRRWPAALDEVESGFLAGYFAGDRVPIEAIRLFEIQHLLYRWSRAARAARWPGLAGWGKRARLTLKTRFFRQLLERLLDEPAAHRAPAAIGSPSA
jgi:aminoglycoside phosphotransferase (APT) family kinase protein